MELDSVSQLAITNTNTISSECSTNRTHHRFCDVTLLDNQNCTCTFIEQLEQKVELRKSTIQQSVSPTSDSFQSIILAGHLEVSSQPSSEASFYSAECTVPLGNTLKSDNSRPTSPETIRSSASEIVNKNNDGIKAIAPDLNAAQDLFKALEIENVYKNNTTEETINFTNTTEYSEIRPFLKRFSQLLLEDSDDNDDDKIISHLSKVYTDSPDQFRKRLVTIIEESDLRLSGNNTAVSLDQLISEYKKSCKYIQDESMPTMAETLMLSPSDNLTHTMEFNIPKLCVETATPVGQAPQFVKITPMRNVGKSQASPLYISALSRGIGITPDTPTGQYPLTPKTNTPMQFSPHGTPGSGGKHNDSSFTVHEKQCGTGGILREKLTCQQLMNEEWKKNAEIQEKLLATMSPRLSPRKKIIQSPLQSSRVTEADEDLAISLPASESDSEDDFTKGIIHELEKKRMRCFETQKTIREIDSESSGQTSYDNDTTLEFLDHLTNCAEYHNFLKSENIRQTLRQREDSGVDVRASSATSQCSRAYASTEKLKYGNKGTIKDSANVTMRKTPGGSMRKKPPTFKSSCPRYTSNLGQRRLAKSPMLKAQSYLRSISPIERPSSSISSSQSSLSSLGPSRKVRTPHAQLNSLSVFNPTPKIRTPTNAKKTPTQSTGKFFNTPGKTPVPKVRTRPAAYFPIDSTKKSTGLALKSHTPIGLYDRNYVRSPVAAYIHGTDSTLIKNIRSKDNEYLLTPRSHKISTNRKEGDHLKFKLRPRCDGLEQQVDERRIENAENFPDNGYNHPEVHYKLPAKIEEVCLLF